jgi:hypothetical protein
MTKKIISAVGFLCVVCFCSQGYAASLDWLKGALNSATSTKLSATTVGQGLKEALRVGIENAIKSASKTNGYLDNQAVKILLPDKLKNAEALLRKAGLGQKIDEFVLSMNRAAEKAAPAASDILASALTDLSFDDAVKIFKGQGTAATDYFKAKTSAKLTEVFKPMVTKSMNDYEVTRKFNEILTQAKTLPLVGQYLNVDLDNYVTDKSLTGLFRLVGQEEQKIRTDPQSRVTDLLKQVFGSTGT